MGKNDPKKRFRLLGVSRQESTGNLVLVAEKFCNTCGGLFPGDDGPWCDKCNIKQLMEGWTTGNAEYDATIPSRQLQNLNELTKGEFGTIYVAYWTKGEYSG